MRNSVNSVDYIYEQLAAKYNLSPQAIEHIVVDIWKGVKSEMGSRRGKDITLPNFGSIYVDHKKLKEQLDGIHEIAVNVEKEFIENKAHYAENYNDWINYIRRSTRINQVRKMYQTMTDNIEKRKNRKKGERGL